MAQALQMALAVLAVVASAAQVVAVAAVVVLVCGHYFDNAQFCLPV